MNHIEKLSQNSVIVLVPLNNGSSGQELKEFEQNLAKHTDSSLFLKSNMMQNESDNVDMNFNNAYVNGTSPYSKARLAEPHTKMNSRNLSEFLPKLNSFRLASVESSSSLFLKNVTGAQPVDKPQLTSTGFSGIFTDDLNALDNLPMLQKQFSNEDTGLFLELGASKERKNKKSNSFLLLDNLLNGLNGKYDMFNSAGFSMDKKGATSHGDSGSQYKKGSNIGKVVISDRAQKDKIATDFLSDMHAIHVTDAGVPPTPPFSAISNNSSARSSASSVAAISATNHYMKAPSAVEFYANNHGFMPEAPKIFVNNFQQYQNAAQASWAPKPMSRLQIEPVQRNASKSPASAKLMDIPPMYCLAGCGKKLDKPKGRGRPSSGKCTTCRKRDNKRQWRHSKRAQQLQQNAINAMISEHAVNNAPMIGHTHISKHHMAMPSPMDVWQKQNYVLHNQLEVPFADLVFHKAMPDKPNPSKFI